LRGGKFRRAQVDNPVNPADVSLPPYYPDDEVLRADWATYLNSVLNLDREVKHVLERLDAEGLTENSVIFLFTDHGISHLRGKQFLYEEGIKIPLIVRWPAWLPAGERRSELVSQIDIAATSLFLAGIPVPAVMQGRPFFGKDYIPRDHIYAARDRCDETIDMIRAVRTQNYKYIRNLLPDRSHAQPNQYKDGKPFIAHMRELYGQGNLKAETAVYFQPTRPVEELYDLVNDPWEMNNLAEDPKYAELLAEMSVMLWQTSVQTGDMGYIPEPLLEEIPGMLEGLRHTRPEVRFWAAYGLGNIGQLDEATSTALGTALNDGNEPVRIAAARALCRSGESDIAFQVLLDNLNNNNRITGMHAAGFIEDLPLQLIRKAIPELKKALDSPYAFTQRIATRLISKAG
jgi:hypothetical protein